LPPSQLDLTTAFAAFFPARSLCEFAPLSSGHIHATFWLRDDQGQQFVLQRLNQRVFSDLAAMAHNLAQLQAQLPRQAAGLHFPQLYPDQAGQWIHRAPDGSAWRLQTFLPETYTLTVCPNASTARSAGEAVGRFLAELNRALPEPLQATIPGFHDIRSRWQQLEAAVAQAKAERLEAAWKTWQSVQAHWHEWGPRLQGVSLLLPRRNVHNDPKLGNLLFSQVTHQPVALIDWDTVMPGNLLTDYGDLVRSVCASAPEDEADLERVFVQKSLLTAVTAGFSVGLGELLAPEERAHLPLGPIWIMLEQAIRFLADYLAGDVYYPVAFPRHNLVRAQNQLGLLGSWLESRE